MKKEIPLRVVVAGLALCFCLFVAAYERHTLQLHQHALEDNARIIAESVQDHNLTRQKEYLDTTAEHNDFRNLVVTSYSGKALYETANSFGESDDGLLKKAGLIRDVQLQAPIVFKGQSVGSIAALWRNKAAYLYVNLLILGAFLLTVLKLGSRILASNRILEEKVAGRTAELEAANRALQESRRHYRQLIEEANSIILRRRTDGTITFMNEFGLRFFGYTAAEITGRDVRGTIVAETESSGRSLAAMIEDIGRNPQNYVTNENENICKDGRRVWISWTNRAVVDESGRTTEILSIGTDATARRLAEEKLLRSESLLQEAQQIAHTGSWSNDLRDQKTSWSDELFRLLGYEPGEIEPSFELFARHIHPDDLQRLVRLNSSDPAELAAFSPQEYRLIRRDGSLRHIVAKSTAHLDDRGRTVQIHGIIQDITELKLGQAALGQSQARFARMAASIENGLTIVEQGKIVYANDRVCEIFGIPKDDYLRRGFDPTAIAAPEEKQRMAELRENHLANKPMPEIITFWIVLQTGERRYIRSRYSYRTWAGDATHCYIVTTDDTARKTAEESLRQSLEKLRGREQELQAVNMQLQASNQQLRASRTDLENAVKFLENIFATSIDGFITTNERGYVIQVNNAALQILGYTAAADVIGRHMAELTPQQEPYMSTAAQAMVEMREQGFIKDKPTYLLRQDGTICPVEYNGTYLRNEQGAIIGAVASIKDITERRQAEEALRENEERFRALAETSPDAIFTTDADMSIVFWNAAAERIFGYARHDIIGRPAELLIPKSRLPLHQADRTLLLETGQSPAYQSPMESTALRRDGTEFPVEVALTSWWQRERPFFSMIVRDITERKRAENELRSSNEYLRSIFRASPDIILATDWQGDITMISDTAIKLFEQPADELLGQSTGLLLPFDEEGQRMVKEMMHVFMNTGAVKNYEIPWIKKDGSIVHIEWNGLLLWDDEGCVTGSVGVIRDISGRKMLESQIRQAQKMESIGTLAGGIAHDFNNLLTAIFGYTEMNLYQAGDNSTVKYNSENVLRAANRARELVKQILAFSRPGDEERKPVQASLIVKEAVKLLRASLPASIDMQLDLASEAYVLAAPAQIHQIIINLCTNAYHAMQERGGRLSVRLEDAAIDDREASRLPELQAGRYVRLTVSDTGCGIDPKIVHRIFDPFFTTKETGKGTGMGLAMVYGIVKSHGGAITVASEIGRGCTFTVYIPLIAGAAAAGELPEPEAPTGTERILLVDDEELLVQVGQEMLLSLGYSVTTAGGSLKALELFKEQPDAFDMVITDYTMPGMNGRDFALEVLKLRPKTPIMLCTGFSENMSQDKAEAAGISAFVMKPFNRLEFARAIRSVLG